MSKRRFHRSDDWDLDTSLAGIGVFSPHGILSHLASFLVRGSRYPNDFRFYLISRSNDDESYK